MVKLHFEKVRYEAFEKDMMMYRPINYLSSFDVRGCYESIKLPVRKTKASAGYDICTPIAITLPPRERRVIPTGIKACFTEEEMATWHLQMYVRSSVGIKDGVVLTNSTGIIDPDYCLDENDVDIMLALMNTSSKTVKYKAGDRICQAVFMIHGITSDDTATDTRTGGVGSTGIR